MHHIYHTEAIILGSKNYGDSGKVFFLFTRELGMIYAGATGIRKMSSRLRYILQDYAYVKVDLVRGKDMWRLTSASKTLDPLDFQANPDALKAFANITRLLRRLLAGEAKQEMLFDDLLKNLFTLSKVKGREELKNIEIIIVLRVLNHLGYIGEHKHLDTFISSPFEEEMIFEIAKNRKTMLLEINKALRETQM